MTQCLPKVWMVGLIPGTSPGTTAERIGLCLYIFSNACRWRNRKTIFIQTLDVEANSFPDFIFDLTNGCSRSDAARQVGDIGRIICVCLLDYNCMAYFLQMPLHIHALVQDADYFNHIWLRSVYEDV